MSQFFEILILRWDFCGNVHHTREMNLISSWKSEKASFSSERNKLKEIRFCRRKTPEDDNLKINVSPNIPCAFLLFKASAFYFREKWVLSFASLDKWNVNKNIAFSIVIVNDEHRKPRFQIIAIINALNGVWSDIYILLIITRQKSERLTDHLGGK